jgi:hypothetical protein
MHNSKSEQQIKYHYIKGDNLSLGNLYYGSSKNNESLAAQLVAIITMSLLAASLIW